LSARLLLKNAKSIKYYSDPRTYKEIEEATFSDGTTWRDTGAIKTKVDVSFLRVITILRL
ncbi:MAG: hypothetical protein ACXWCG_12870, partial [Flavitalea sp.]